MEPIDCPSCGTNIPNNDDRCPKCGFRLREYLNYLEAENKNSNKINQTEKIQIDYIKKEDDKLDDKKIFDVISCPKCGMKVSSLVTRCSKCGFRIKEYIDYLGSESEGNNKKKNRQLNDNKSSASDKETEKKNAFFFYILLGVFCLAIVILVIAIAST